MTRISRSLIAASFAAATIAAGAQAQDDTQRGCGVYVFFNSGQSGVGPQARDVLIEYARSNPGAELVITGYSDAAGNAAANQALSLQRANSVAAALSGTNILSVNGAGEAVRPGTTGPTDPSNRRVEALRQDCTGVPGPVDANAGLVAGAGVAALALGAALGDGSDGDDDTATTTD